MSDLHHDDNCATLHDLDEHLDQLRRIFESMPADTSGAIDKVAEAMIHDLDSTAGRLRAIKSRDVQIGAIVTMGMIVEQFANTPLMSAREASVGIGIVTSLGTAMIAALDKANE